MTMRICVISVVLKLLVVTANVSPAPVEVLNANPPQQDLTLLTMKPSVADQLTSIDLEDKIVEALATNGTAENSNSLWGVQAIKDSLEPIVAASPKNEYGRLGDGAARYALHRLFLERHGWEIKSFGELAVEASDSSSSSKKPSLFEHWVPPEVQKVLEVRVRDQGFGLLELAVFAASLEHVIRAELPRKLQDTYRALGVPTTGSISKAEADHLIDLYMGAFIRSEDLTMLSPFELFKFQTDMSFVYDNWDKTRQFFRGIRESVVPNTERLTFADVEAVMESIENNFVYWNEHQCEAFKEDLMSLERDIPGRLRLLDFYDAGLYKGMDRLVETMEYLKQLGTVDETDPLEPRVILSNYLHSPSNCVARNSYYSVCCMNQCDDLYNHLERNLGKAEATADEIITVVSGLSTATTCNIIADEIQEKLHAIAGKNGGQVSLHGQAFAEWMHFVYPRECTWQQKFGPAYFQTVGEWESSTHSESQADTPELLGYAKELRSMEKAKIARAAKSAVPKKKRAAFMAPVVAEPLAAEEELPIAGDTPLHQWPTDEETPMIGASRKKAVNKRDKKLLLTPEMRAAAEGHPHNTGAVWWVAPALGALYGSGLLAVKLLGFRSESLREREASCGASCSTFSASSFDMVDKHV